VRLRAISIAAAAAISLVLLVGVVGAWAQGSTQPKALYAVLTGENELSPTGERGAGDPDGRGLFGAVLHGNKLCYALAVAKIGTPTLAHIHRGDAATNGPIVVHLKAPRRGNPGASADCVTIDSALAGEIRGNPAGFYVNVHNADFPSGAIRGQLSGVRH
jgi:CHRD domain